MKTESTVAVLRQIVADFDDHRRTADTATFLERMAANVEDAECAMLNDGTLNDPAKMDAMMRVLLSKKLS